MVLAHALIETWLRFQVLFKTCDLDIQVGEEEEEEMMDDDEETEAEADCISWIFLATSGTFWYPACHPVYLVDSGTMLGNERVKRYDFIRIIFELTSGWDGYWNSSLRCFLMAIKWCCLAVLQGAGTHGQGHGCQCWCSLWPWRGGRGWH